MLLQRQKYAFESTEAQVGMLGGLLSLQITLRVYIKYRHYYLSFSMEENPVAVFYG